MLSSGPALEARDGLEPPFIVRKSLSMPEKLPLGALIIGIVDRPGRTLANIVAYPRWRWVFPIILALAALALSLILTASLRAAQSQQVLSQQLSRMSPSQAEQVRQQMATFTSPTFVAGVGFVTGLLVLLIGWLIQAAILYFADLLAGGELQFGQILAVVPWLHLPFALEQLLQTAFILSQGKLIANQGLSYLVSSGNALQDARNLAYVALSQVTLFRLWHLVLVFALFRGAARFSRATAFWLTLAYEALLLAGAVGLAAIGRVLSPG
jgi:hypothetical protein